MRNSEEMKRSRILKKQLRKSGIKRLSEIECKCIFGIRTPFSNNFEIIAELKESSLIMTAIIDEEISPEDSSALNKIGEFLHRVNIGLITGKFELDYDDGDLRFSASVPFKNVYPETEIYQRLILIITSIIDKYLPGIKSITNAMYTPKEAYEACEKSELLSIHLKEHISEILDRLISECDTDINEKDDSESCKVESSVTFSKEFEDLIRRLGYMP